MNKKDVRKKKKKSIKSKIVTFVFELIVFIGLGAIAYPTLSNWWNERHQTQAISSYVETVQELSDDGKIRMMEEAKRYNKSLAPGVDFVLTDEEYESYESILDITGTGIMGYVEIPAIDVNLPIYHGTDEAVLQIATGHIAGSSFPVGGEGTHAIISGHRGLPTANLFTNLDKLVVGDLFMVTVLDQVLTYQIDQIRIVLPEDVSSLAIENGKDYMTLVTCTPYGVNTHRMLVRGTRIDNIEEENVVIIVPDATRISQTYVICGIGVPLIMLAMVISFILSAIRGIRKSDSAILEEMENSVDLGGKEDDE